MEPFGAEVMDSTRLDAIIQFDCRVRRWLGRVPHSTIVILVDAILDEMKAREHPRRQPTSAATGVPERRPSTARVRSAPPGGRWSAARPHELASPSQPPLA
jgi:hypothetical protein